MKKIFLLIALGTSINVSAQKEYTTKGIKSIVQFDGVERVKNIETTLSVDWEITDSTLVRMDWVRGRASCDVTKKTKLKNGTIVYDIEYAGSPMRVEITDRYLIFYDPWPNWDSKLIHPLVKK